MTVQLNDTTDTPEAAILRCEITELERERKARGLRTLSAEGVTCDPRDGQAIRAMLDYLGNAGLCGEAAAYVAHEIEARRFALRMLGEAA